MSRTLLLLASLLLCFGAPANLLLAGDWFVDAVNGNDANAGTAPGAGNAFETITQALSVVSGGECIVVAAGTYDTALGETFPMVIPDDVIIMGAGSTLTSVDATGAGTNVFEVTTAHTGTTILQGMEIVNDTTQDLIQIWDAVADFQLLSCELVDGASGLILGISTATGNINLLISGNTFDGFEGYGVFISAWGITNAMSVDVVGNDFAGGAAASGGMHAYASNWSGPGVAFNLLCSDNVAAGISGSAFFGRMWAGSGVSGMANFDFLNNSVDMATVGIAVSLTAGNSGLLDANVLFESNVVGNVTGGMGLAGSANGTATLSAVLDIIDNCVDAPTSTGMLLSARANSSGVVVLNGLVDGNAVTSAGAWGMGFYARAVNAGSVLMDLDVANNCVLSGNSGGMWFTASAFTAGDATLLGQVYGNVVMDNADTGVWVFSSETGAASALCDPDFGGGTVVKGRNVFLGNDTAGASIQFNATGSVNTSLSATGNWWGTTVLATIETLVNHDVDAAALPLVDFSMPLADPLVFTAPAGVVPLQVVALTSGANSRFVEYAGKKEILVRVNGVVVVPTVAANGATLDFALPPGFVAGALTISVVNPGGQAGAFTVVILGGDSDSGCFVATAAFGELDAPEVLVLRRWRDECLADNAIGRQLVKAYYAVSPDFAGAIADSPAARTVSRAALMPVVGAAKLWLDLPWAYAVAGGALLLRLMRRKSG